MNYDVEFEDAIRFLSREMPDAKDLIKPTLLHCVRVGIYLYENGYDREVTLGGLLHDVIEDTRIEEDELRKLFGNEVTELVLANSKNLNLTKEEQGEDLISRCAEFSENALIIKATDILDNIKYYCRIEHKDSIDKMLHYSNLLFNYKKNTYKDPIFYILNDVVSSYKHLE